MEEKQTWRELLGLIISEPYERQRIADMMGINPITLMRWVSGKSHPRRDNLQPLLDALPQYRQELSELIAQEYPQFFKKAQVVETTQAMIPSEFYACVLQAYTNSPMVLRAATVEALILQQLGGQLDPQRKGLSVGVVQCVPPKPGQKVRSLRVTFHCSTMEAEQLVEHQTLFLGAESQAGYALSIGHPSIMQNEADILRMFPVHHFILEKSAVAYPILLSNRVAGSLYISSTEENYFTQMYQDLISNYVDLMVLSFENDEFYHLSDIVLGIMPSQCVQRPYLTTIQQRVKQKLVSAAQEKRAMTRLQAEYIIWQELEEELHYLTIETSA